MAVGTQQHRRGENKSIVKCCSNIDGGNFL